MGAVYRFDPRRLPDVREFGFTSILSMVSLYDTGSHSIVYLRDHPDVKARLYPRFGDGSVLSRMQRRFSSRGFDRPEEIAKIFQPTNKEYYVDFSLLHHVGGSGIIRWS